MSRYAIGDVQGCWDPLRRLLDAVRYDPAKDQLWLAGDLVNRGEASADVLRFLMAEGATCVLGNHDVHLLKRAAGASKRKKLDTLDEVLNAPDRAELLEWLRHRPLVHREGELAMVHAGFLPGWDWATIERRAADASAMLSGDDWRVSLRSLFKRPDVGATLDVLTRLRLVDDEGRAAFGFAGPPEQAPEGKRPWFAAPGRKTDDLTVLFGHWAALGHRMGKNWIALDSACVWGGKLTAVRLEDRAVFQVPCR